MAEFQRLQALAGDDWDWKHCAVIARNWAELEPLRARQTLSLARFDGRRHPLLDDLKPCDALLRRPAGDLPPREAGLSRTYFQASPGDVNLGYAGGKSPEDALHRQLAELLPGDPLSLRDYYGKWELADSRGRAVGRMAAGWERPAGDCLEARVRAVIRRTRQQTDEKYLARVHPGTETWEVVLPELVFAPVVG